MERRGRYRRSCLGNSCSSIWGVSGSPGHKGARYALWKNPESLTARQQSKLADIERLNRPLYRAYLLKEQLRQIYRLPARRRLPCSRTGCSGRGAVA